MSVIWTPHATEAWVPGSVVSSGDTQTVVRIRVDGKDIQVTLPGPVQRSAIARTVHTSCTEAVVVLHTVFIQLSMNCLLCNSNFVMDSIALNIRYSL